MTSPDRRARRFTFTTTITVEVHTDGDGHGGPDAEDVRVLLEEALVGLNLGGDRGRDIPGFADAWVPTASVEHGAGDGEAT